MTNDELKKYDFILCLDKSGSMSMTDMPGGKTRWTGAKEATVALGNKCAEFDTDGITVIPFANTWKKYDNITGAGEKLEQIFKENEPNGGTNTAGVLKAVFDEYFASKKKPIIVLVVTDGVPNDEDELANVIVAATKKMDKDEEIGVSFIQIGKDAAATTYLKKLDDGLVAKGAKFDIVDTKTADEMEGMLITDVIVAALTD